MPRDLTVTYSGLVQGEVFKTISLILQFNGRSRRIHLQYHDKITYMYQNELIKLFIVLFDGWSY